MAGTAWLLQFIEDLQQSRAFHETCQLEPFEWKAAKMPEVCHSLLVALRNSLPH